MLLQLCCSALLNSFDVLGSFWGRRAQTHGLCLGASRAPISQGSTCSPGWGEWGKGGRDCRR